MNNIDPRRNLTKKRRKYDSVDRNHSVGHTAIIVMIVEIVIVMVPLFLIGYDLKNPIRINVALKNISSDYMNMSDGKLIVKDGIINESPTDNNRLLLTRGPYMSLGPGSYTAYIRYNTDTQQHCQFTSSSSAGFIHANTFNLSKNKTSCNYDFFLTQKVKDFEIRFTDYEGGDFEISRITIVKNTHNLRLLLFVLLVVFIVLDSIWFIPTIKNNRNTLLAILSIAMLASLITYMDGLAVGHDYGFHFARIESIADGLKVGEIPVKMYSFFNDGYGYPVGIFYGDALLYIPAIMRMIGFSVITSYKIYIWTINILTTISAYWCGLRIFKKKQTALVVSLSYVLASYRLVDIYVRSAVGEYTSFIFYPIILLAIWNIYTKNPKEKEYMINAVYLSVGVLGLLYTHVLSVEMVMITLITVAIVFLPHTLRKRTLSVYCCALFLTLILGAAFWIPFIDYYVHADVLIKQTALDSKMLIQDSGAYISDYFAFFRDFYGGDSVVVTERMQLSPGPVLMLALICAVTLFIVSKKPRRALLCATGFSIMLLLVASDIFPWNMIAQNTSAGNYLSQIQFPWRFIGLAVVSLSLLLGLLIEDEQVVAFFGKALYPSIIAACFISVCLCVSNSEDCGAQSHFLDSAELPQYTYAVDEGPSGLGASEYIIPGSDCSKLDHNVIENNAVATILTEEGTDVNVNIEKSGKNSHIDIPRFAYPYYIATDSTGEELITETGINNRIRVVLPDGYRGEINVRFVEPWYWRLSELLSVAVAFAGLIFAIYKQMQQMQ